MPIKKSAMKEVRKVKKRHERNVEWKIRLKKQEKKVRELIAGGDKALSLTELAVLTRLLDRAAGKKIIHKKTSARKKSRITKQINKLSAKKV